MSSRTPSPLRSMQAVAGTTIQNWGKGTLGAFAAGCLDDPKDHPPVWQHDPSHRRQAPWTWSNYRPSRHPWKGEPGKKREDRGSKGAPARHSLAVGRATNGHGRGDGKQGGETRLPSFQFSRPQAPCPPGSRTPRRNGLLRGGSETNQIKFPSHRCVQFAAAHRAARWAQGVTHPRQRQTAVRLELEACGEVSNESVLLHLSLSHVAIKQTDEDPHGRLRGTRMFMWTVRFHRRSDNPQRRLCRRRGERI
jgi:hypothetical protein